MPVMHLVRRQASGMYEATFGIDPNTNYGEGVVANNALALNPFWQDYFRIDDDKALQMAEIGNCCLRSQTEKLSCQMPLEELKLLGCALISYAENTARDLYQIPPHMLGAFSTRRLEGKIAGNLATIISRRNIAISAFREPAKLFTIGFSR
ncbi:hypothetical protein KC960_03900 [Candidatus Saccharibacteria bacterium]|nr:hypothetical protein [Candidatus Saccharibacteria bacterium]